MGAAWLILQPLALNALTVPATAYIIRRMGPEGYGLWGISAGLVATVLFLTSLGVRPLFVRAIAQDPSRAPEAFAEQLGLRTLLACGAGLVALAACLILRYPPVVLACTLIGAVGLVCTAVGSSVTDLLYARERLGESAGITFAAGLLLTASSVLAAWAGWGPVGLAGAYVVGPAASAVLSLWLVRRKFFPVRVRWDLGRFRALIRESRALAAQVTVGSLGTNAEALLVPKLLGATIFGYFSAGMLLPNRLTVISDGIGTAFYPVLSRKWAEDRREAGAEALRFFGLSVGSCSLMAVCGWLIAGPAAQILFPEDPGTCRTVIAITMWGLPLYAVADGMFQCLNASGHHSLQARRTILATLVGLGVTLLLISRLGIVGACLSWLVRPSIAALFYIPAFWKVFGPYLIPGKIGPQRSELSLADPVEAG